ncbi:hypothetical protein Nepgr_023127 [Nepenthes gracilis]|uniref:Uncharacterized protein n=1 Tax=Nepenthes gracilis TaxID=150966 RepID=A0AAD3XYT8_NEPGR|nr:hypothetical protein Nepgr_023127 [Nepenthes gracilis]
MNLPLDPVQCMDGDVIFGPVCAKLFLHPRPLDAVRCRWWGGGSAADAFCLLLLDISCAARADVATDVAWFCLRPSLGMGLIGKMLLCDDAAVCCCYIRELQLVDDNCLAHGLPAALLASGCVMDHGCWLKRMETSVLVWPQCFVLD